MSVGTLQPRKNYEKSILAFDKFKKDYPDYKFVIVGQKGWKYDRIFELISNRKLGESVIITGFVTEDDLKTLYTKTLQVYLSTSLWEGFGLPLIEAYYFDLPLVVSDIEIFHEVVENNAMFVDPNSEDEIKAALVKAVSGKQNNKR
ncbi:MAG: hypothetical protein KatS3mg085_016 [Candidatus Dojkabacteria bacterium]|nr:MAG: hypothetical protein KatS3mg085_016 [Candidatus Dojkabacteria bacterium]